MFCYIIKYVKDFKKKCIALLPTKWENKVPCCYYKTLTIEIQTSTANGTYTPKNAVAWKEIDDTLNISHHVTTFRKS